jgi:sterol desaturase/sphingolipid hydroxylase (fatty acid hydroxylase superfamily)
MELRHFVAYGIFFLVVGLESLIASRRNLALYQGRDFSNNILLGLFTTILMVIGKGTFLAFFAFCNRFAPFHIGMVWWSWIVLFFLNELMFYWFHRLSHEIRILWAFHVAHHSSVHYNFSTAVRNNFFIQFFRYLAWAPAALIGFDPFAIILMDSIAYFYQLFVHTQLVRNLGFLDWFMNTPSNHRVHHGTNPQYIDRNYGAAIILWDRLFGSYQKEEENVRFGITRNIRRQSVPVIMFHEFVAIGRDIARSGSPGTALRYIFGHPGWEPGK